MNPFENRPPATKPEHDALVNRLQTLEWTDVRPELRERCWEEFLNRAPSRRKALQGSAGTGERYTFTRVGDRPGARPVADARAATALNAPLRLHSGRI
jgi:hypothetical protein